MKNHLKYITRAIALVILMSITISRLYSVFSWKDTTGGYLSSYSQLYHTPENTMDVIFVGSSHVYCDIYPSILWRDYGIAAFDMAVSGQDRESSYYSIKETLKTQSPKIVCVEMYSFLYDKHDVIANEYRNMLGMRMSKNSMALVRDYADGDTEKEKNYILRWPIIHTRYKELEKNDFVDYRPSIYGRGADCYWEIGSCEVDANAMATKEVGKLTKDQVAWLDKLVALSRENDFKLVLFMSPHWQGVDEQKTLNAVAEYAENNGIYYYDINMNRDKLGLTLETDYLDSFHTNAYGAEKMTSYFANVVFKEVIGEDEKYSLTDHRGDEEYLLWDMDLEDFNHKKTKYDLKQIGDPAEYINRLVQLKNITVIVSTEGNLEGKDYSIALGLLGVPEETWKQGGKWVWREGLVVSGIENDTEQKVVYKLSPYDFLRLQYLGDYSGQNVMVNGESYQNTQDGLVIIVYDNMREEILSYKEF